MIRDYEHHRFPLIRQIAPFAEVVVYTQMKPTQRTLAKSGHSNIGAKYFFGRSFDNTGPKRADF